MHEGGGVLRRVVLHDPVHVRDVEAPRRHVRAEQCAWSGVALFAGAGSQSVRGHGEGMVKMRRAAL